MGEKHGKGMEINGRRLMFGDLRVVGSLKWLMIASVERWSCSGIGISQYIQPINILGCMDHPTIRL
jgi:hypothetical protein